MTGRASEEVVTEATLKIERGRVNEYLMPFPLSLSTVPFNNIPFLGSLGVAIAPSPSLPSSPLSFLPPPLPPAVQPCTFLFRRAPLVPGRASHTRLMASLEGGREQDEVKMVTADSSCCFFDTVSKKQPKCLQRQKDDWAIVERLKVS